MLDLFAVFTRGGALLWTLQFTALRHSPVEALNTLIKSCLLEERSGVNTYTYSPKLGAQQAMKWTFHNGLGLVFVAVYQKALSLLYVDELLAAVKAEFTTSYYKPNVLSYPEFTDTFQNMYKEAEARAERLKLAGAAGATRDKLTTAAAGQLASGKGGRSGTGKAANGSAGAAANGVGAGIKGGSEEEEEGEGDADGARGPRATDDGSVDGQVDDVDEDKGEDAFDLSKLPKGGKGPGARGRSGKLFQSNPLAGALKKKDDKDKDAPKKKPRNWGAPKGSGPTGELDFSRDKQDHSEYTGGSESEKQGYSDVESIGRRTPLGVGISKVDIDEEPEDILPGLAEQAASGGAAKSQGLLGSFMSSLALRVVGKTSLAADDLAPALADMKRKLMERNVAEEISQSICDSVGRSLEGQKLASFTGVGTFVARAFEEALAGILHKRTVDMLLDIRKAQERGRPYVVVFCGVNGVGKSTNLAKIAYWLGQHGVKVLIAACDTFRAGAVEQLKTHCARLQVPLYERGYEKDPAKVASEAIKQAEREGRHVVLVDTAGRMQDNEPLMRALSSLINVNNPNLVLFVGEALVGNDAVDQLVKFNRALHDLAPPTATTRHAIDGIVLTKFDTIDDKVGAAVSMVYASGAPIMFLGCGQTYADLKKLNVKAVVNALLK